MTEQEGNDLAKQVIELKGEIKDAALRVRTGIDTHTVALNELAEQMKKLNLNVERLWRKT